MGRIAALFFYLAVVCIVMGIVFKVFGYGDHEPVTLISFLGEKSPRLTPDAFLRFTNTMLLFSIAVGLADIAGKMGLTGKNKDSE